MVGRVVACAMCVLSLALSACGASPAASVKGTVMQPGQSLRATNKFGSVRVTYVSSEKRRFEWDGHARVVKMIARQEPWRGELGLYDPAECFNIIVPLCRTPRLVVGEAAHDFDSYEQLYAFLYEGSAAMDWAYTSDGLLVGFGRSSGREEISVDVRQLTIRGSKPVALKGARDGSIRLTAGR